MPARLRSPALVMALGSSLAVLYLLVAMAECVGQPVGVFDEALYYVGSMLVARGERVHVDFHSSYPPLNYALSAWVFKLFGQTALVVRLWHCALYLLLIGALASLYRRLGTRTPALGFALLGAVALTSPLPALPSFHAVGFCLAAVIAYLHGLTASTTSARLLWLAVAGALAGWTVTVRFSWGAYAMVAFCVDQLVELHRRRREADSLRASFADAGVVSAGLALCGVAFLLAYGQRLPAMIHEVIVVPSVALGSYAIPAYGPGVGRLGALGLVLPLVVPCWLAARSVTPRARGAWLVVAFATMPFLLWAGHGGSRGLGLLSVPLAAAPLVHQLAANPLPRTEFISLTTAALFAHYYLIRPDYEHQAPATAAVALLVGFICNEWRSPAFARAGTVLRGAAVTLLALPPAAKALVKSPSLATAAQMLSPGRPQGSDDTAIAAGSLPLPRPLAGLYENPDESRVVQFLGARTRPDEAVYVGMQDHRRPYVNNIRLYWMLGRQVGVRHLMLGAGITSTHAAQEEMIRDLVDRRVRWVVLWAGMAGPAGFAERNPGGSSLLDDYLAAEFETVATFGDFLIKHSTAKRLARQ